MSHSKQLTPRKGIQKLFSCISRIFHLPSQSQPTVNLNEIGAILELLKDAVTGQPQNDRHYLMERVIQLAAALPETSLPGKALTNGFLKLLWNDLQHPPISFLGEEYRYRAADGANNNILWPHIGAAGSSYARSVQPRTVYTGVLPDPDVLFDTLLARKNFVQHPAKISSTFFHLASVVIHDLFRTDRRDSTRSLTSSYLDLAPLYGSNQEEQNLMRTFQDGKLKADCFSAIQVLGFPPGVGAILIMFNRFHNHVVENLARINEGGRFTKPNSGSDKKAHDKYDNDLFQTGRLVTCGLYVNIILKDYVRTILNLNPTNSTWNLDPRADISASKATGNQVSAEFNLLYRWHACISDSDAKWTEGLYRTIFPHVPSGQVTVPQFLQGITQWEKSIPNDPQKRSLGDLTRGADGLYLDDDLVKIFKDSVEDCAGAFGAQQIPTVLKAVEVLGIQQARGWNLASLNEFREFFQLTPHKTFEDINPDPYIIDKLKELYGHPDHVELYPGLMIEQAKEEQAPGSGLCTGFSISRAILSDAVSLVRGDRFHTIDWSPRNVTNWGFTEVAYDNTVDFGCVFYKLVLQAFPCHFRKNSIYAHFPMMMPAENQKIMDTLGLGDTYSFDAPARSLSIQRSS